MLLSLPIAAHGLLILGFLSAPTAGPTPRAAPPISAAAVDTTQYVVAPEGNEARYRVREQLVGVSFPNDAVGATTGIEGGIAIDQAGRLVAGMSRITVDLASMASDRDMRDNYVRRNTLTTATYPSVLLVPTELRGLTWPLPATGEVTFQLIGNLTVKDVTRSTTWDVTLRIIDANTLAGTATTSFTFEEFALTKPRVARVMSVDDTIKLEYDLKLVRQ